MIDDIPQPIDRYLDLLVSQYQTSENFKKYLHVFAKQHQELHQALLDSITYRQLDNAYGAMLDVIGALIGASRTLYGKAVTGFYGFDEAIDALPPGDENNPNYLAGYLRDENESDTEDYVMTDAEFRRFIYARIIKNSTNCSIEQTIAFFQALLGDSTLGVAVYEEDNDETLGPATVRIYLDASYNLDTLSYIAATAGHIKPAGVTMILENRDGEINFVRQ